MDEKTMQIQWYPGHMTKTRRMIAEQQKHIDVVCEILDARIPVASRNPDIEELTAGKPRLIILNRIDMADPAATAAWTKHFRSCGFAVLEVNARTGQGTNQFSSAVRRLVADKLSYYAEKGQVGRMVRVMVLGIPNVGKSTFINKISGRKTAKAEDRPGVTRGKQWVPVDAGLELLDTPGILWPKFEDRTVGMHLAYTGAVRDEIMDTETLACHLMEVLAERYPGALEERYKFTPEAGDSGYELLQKAGRKRGFMLRGGEIDTGRMALILLDEFRGGKLGRFTLELPEEV